MTKSLFILFILLITAFPCIESSYSESLTDFREHPQYILNYCLNGDVLYRVESSGRTKLYDKVAAISGDHNTLYYIRCPEDKWIGGFFKDNSSSSVEFIIPGKYEKLFKFAGSNNVFYYLARHIKENADDGPEGSPVFTRFNPDQMTGQSVEGVEDFILLDGRSIVLKNNALDYNGVVIPLLLTGKQKISEIIDSRIAVVTSSEGTEIVDLLSEKSIYQYKEKSIPELPGEYNIILEFNDNITKTENQTDTENSIYYEILIDGVEENRTETGRGELGKTFQSKLDPGKYHIIKPERWELDKVKGRYTRMNNIYQPAEIKIYIPENRILKIKLNFNGTGYVVNQSVLFK